MFDKKFNIENMFIKGFVASTENFLERSKIAYDVMADELLSLMQINVSHLRTALEDLNADKRLHEFFNEFIKKTKEGKTSAELFFEKKWTELQDHLDVLINEKPRLVGILDGAAKVYFGFDTDTRKNQCSEYFYWQGLGCAIGFLSSIWFFGAGAVRTFIATLPITSRLATMLKRAYDEAAEVQSENDDTEPTADDQNPAGAKKDGATPVDDKPQN